MSVVQRLVALLADLRLAIGLLAVIAIASGIGTAIPQLESSGFYQDRYDERPWLGLLDGKALLRLQLDHVYSSSWFLALLAALALALLLCSWRRQWPALQAALRWVDYQQPRQLSKLAVAETLALAAPQQSLDALEQRLKQQGWQLKRQEQRLAARRGIIGRVGPLLVHAGMVLLMLGAAWGSLAGQRVEQFLAPGRSLELLDRQGSNQLTLELKGFAVQRDPAGRPEQFSSQLRLIGSQRRTAAASAEQPATLDAEISVNHPLRYRGMTLYQADWALAAIDVQLGRSPVLQLPLQSFPQLGEQIWGLVLPTRPDGSEPVLLTITSEAGPVEVYGSEGRLLGQISVGGEPLDVSGLPIRVHSVLPASGILLKRDPGVPLVYGGFALVLLGGGFSLVATRQLWAIVEGSGDRGRLHVAGLCNRNLTAFAAELPQLLTEL
ncbi:MAG: cytochrome c biogenesis protein ResB [Cyanobacteriota bacterium]|nr:cytochrome c biogenesis protein ResB [Cyanobacteriota bacterium]